MTARRNEAGRFVSATEQDGERSPLEQAQEQVAQTKAARDEAQRVGDEARAKVAAIDADRAAGVLGTDYLGRAAAVAHAQDADEQVRYLGGLLVVAEQAAASYALEDEASALAPLRSEVAAAYRQAVEDARAAVAPYEAKVAEWNRAVATVSRRARTAGIKDSEADPTLPVRMNARGAVLVAEREFGAFTANPAAIYREAQNR